MLHTWRPNISNTLNIAAQPLAEYPTWLAFKRGRAGCMYFSAAGQIPLDGHILVTTTPWRSSHREERKFVDTGPFEQHFPSTSSRPSRAHPGEWIRNLLRRYTLKGATFKYLNIVSPTAYPPFTGPAHSRAPCRTSGRSRPPTPKPMLCCRWTIGRPYSAEFR
jgi:hypothetical protein